ncbi:glycosyltransferase involved in cell wall biosynthesis [Gelidibacter sediminis]|uniref:Glycosyltransferase involved in cell wall biosynthesis n=1 Tax=Gelidibacter sediminis TaxID=1608710 RepID=A0A4V3F6Y1_9FLAO|nr:glycosyltransferase family A protein [Gelidibacter sediminis]TDU34406.1 glycosyltransferase involved in cell wall biosynthesis [Gelidibacter sediminis]
MQDQPLVSIIIPTFNRAHLIGETLDSVLAQTYQNWECIVVDDGSTDGTETLMTDYVTKDTRFQYHQRPDSHLPGGNGARNYGFDLSKGEYVQWFDDDDVMLPVFLEVKLTAFTENNDLIICSGLMVDRDLNSIGILSYDDTVSLFKGFVLWRNQITTNCVLFKRQFLLNLNLFNPQILRGQESEFFSRIFFELSKTQYSILRRELFLYRQHDTTKSTKNEIYVPNFKTSETYVALENLKRSIVLNDPGLIQYFYRLLIHFLFRALEHQDKPNVKNTLSSLTKMIKPLNWWLVLQLEVLVNFLQVQKRSYHKIEMYFKTYKLFHD